MFAAMPKSALRQRPLLPGPYHVVLPYGFRVAGEYSILDDMALVQFEQTNSFVNKSVLNEVAPEVIRFNAWKSVAARVKPFRWKPRFRESGGDSRSDLDWGGTFFEDAEAFVEPLAMFHAAPAICLVAIPYCLHQTATSLLGRPHYHGSYSWGLRVRSFDKRWRSSNLDMCALEEVRNAFGSETASGIEIAHRSSLDWRKRSRAPDGFGTTTRSWTLRSLSSRCTSSMVGKSVSS